MSGFGALLARLCFGAVLLGTATAPLYAQDYPNRPIRLIVPFAPGAGSDVVARLLAKSMSNDLAQSIVVENKAGAGGILANRFVATSKPDGYTLLLMTGAYPAQAAIMKQLGFDPLQDIACISLILEYPFVLIVRPDSPYRTIDDVIAAAKRRPGEMNYATTGVGTIHHLATELFNLMAGVNTVPIAYRGGTTQILELLAGRVDFVFETLPTAGPAIKDGRVRALAETSSQRWPSLPGVPAVAETLPGYDVVSFLALATAGKTPIAVVDKLSAEVARTVVRPDVRDRLRALAGEPRPTIPADMAALLSKQIAKWKKVASARGIEMQ